MIVLRPHQIAAADAVEQSFREGCHKPLMDMCVASGKSLTFAELARREIERGGRVIIGAHTRELVEQNAAACRLLMPDVHVGINAAALGERTWRAPIISAAIQSIHRNAQSFGPITMLGVDEAHLLPHSETGMYRSLHRDLGKPRMVGGSGTVFRLAGGSLVEGEGAPFERVVYRYSIIDGIRDGYLCPAFSVEADDKMDPTRLRTSKGEFTGESQDAQMIASMDNHIAQMIHYWRDRKRWLVFEASTKAAHAMMKRMNEWGIPTGIVLGETPAHERAVAIRAFRIGRLRALVNIAALTTGFDVQEVDALAMRRRTKSLGLYIQMCGRLLRTVGGSLETSIAAGKADGSVLDFAGNIDAHGPLDFIRPKNTIARLVSCEACNARNPGAGMRCWSCDEPMTKLCPACLEAIPKGTLDCGLCGHDMRAGSRDEATPQKLLDTPSGAALIAAYKTGTAREGGWLAIRRVWDAEDGTVFVEAGDKQWRLHDILADHAKIARWLRPGAPDADIIAAVLIPNGASRTSARQISMNGSELIVPMPGAA